MILVKKWHILAFFLGIILVVALVTSVGTVGTSGDTATPTGDFVIIIDPGHGGVDGGAVGVGGTVEKRINLEISLRLRDVLTAAGYTVIMTRDTDISIHDSDATTIRQMKVSDLHNRLALTELYPNSMLVSIHQNILGSASVTGAQVFFSPNNPRSEILAQSIQDRFNQYIQLADDRVIKAAGKNLYLFYNAKNVAVLAECGFLSNREEEQLLCSEEHQKKIVYSIYCGILDYLDAEEGEIQIGEE
ncbi:MAG: N-acetylmuramoyl-L-alanine amidase [Clostridia bacterium]|nr:N-acetylmuramoyl-L-alanine amidase [Clostridia bacterium]